MTSEVSNKMTPPTDTKEKAALWIDGLIKDLTDTTKSLEDCFRKTLVLGSMLKNDKLKEWVKSELNGYGSGETILPDYRIVGVDIKGNIAQWVGGGIMRGTQTLDYEQAKHPYFTELAKGFHVKSSMAALESVIRDKVEGVTPSLVFTVPAQFYWVLEKLYPGWTVEGALIEVSPVAITSILSTLKTKLLDFLLELNEELGNETDYSIMTNPKKVDQLIEHTIGQINVENLTFGTNYQTKGNQNNVVQGNSNLQQLGPPADLVEQIKQLTAQLSKALEADFDANDKEDIASQLAEVNRQLGRDKPNFSIIGKALQIIEGVAVNVGSSYFQTDIVALVKTTYTHIQQFL